MRDGFGGGYLPFLEAIVTIVGSLVTLAVLAGLIVLLVRFLLVGTKAAQLYVAKNAELGSDHPRPTDGPPRNDPPQPKVPERTVPEPPKPERPKPEPAASATAVMPAPSPDSTPTVDFGSSVPPVASPAASGIAPPTKTPARKSAARSTPRSAAASPAAGEPPVPPRAGAAPKPDADSQAE